MMLQKKAAASVAGRNVRASRKASVVVSCQAKPFEPVKQAVAALAAASIVLSPAAAFARLPEGVKSPSTQSEPFELYEKLIEERTGQAEALPELVEAPKGTVSVPTTYDVKPLVAGAETPKASLPVAPLIPDVAPPAPTPAPVETPAPAVIQAAAPAPAAEVSPIRAAAIADAEKSAAVATGAPAAGATAAGAPSPVAIAGGLVGVMAVAAIALGGNKGEEAPAATAAAPATAAEGAEAVATAEGATAAATAGDADKAI